jgi:predicted DsbA family dithiol-disulfide isomerase
MRAVLWSDYLCPWCYIGRDRTALLAELGVDVTVLPYELHPEIPPDGRRIRPGGRLAPVFERVEAMCAEVGLAFRRPDRMPNTRRALQTAEVVRRRWSESFSALHDALFDAHWLRGDPIDDPVLLDRLVGQAGAPADQVRASVEDGTAELALEEAMVQAHEHGVTSTPAWWVDDRLLIPGAQPRETIRRWVTRLQERRRG